MKRRGRKRKRERERESRHDVPSPFHRHISTILPSGLSSLDINRSGFALRFVLLFSKSPRNDCPHPVGISYQSRSPRDRFSDCRWSLRALYLNVRLSAMYKKWQLYSRDLFFIRRFSRFKNKFLNFLASEI